MKHEHKYTVLTKISMLSDIILMMDGDERDKANEEISREQWKIFKERLEGKTILPVLLPSDWRNVEYPLWDEVNDDIYSIFNCVQRLPMKEGGDLVEFENGNIGFVGQSGDNMSYLEYREVESND